MNDRETSSEVVMWWAFIIGLVLAYPIAEMVEEWRQRRCGRRGPI
jgi:hypothetical protein